MAGGGEGHADEAGQEDWGAEAADHLPSKILAQESPQQAGEDCGEDLQACWNKLYQVGGLNGILKFYISKKKMQTKRL